MSSRSIWLLAFAETLLWSSLYYLFPALLLSWEEQFGWHRAELTMAFTLSLLVSAFCAPLAGRLIDRAASPWLLPGSALGGGLLLMLLPLVNSMPWFYALWILIGLCSSGCLYEACFAFVVRHAGVDARKSITHITLVAGFAGTLCFPAARALAGRFGPDVALWVFAALVILLAVPMMYVGVQSLSRLPAPELHPDPEQRSRVSDVLKRPGFWFLSLAFSLFVTNHAAVLNHLMPILKEWSLPPELGVLAVAMIGPMQVLGRLLWMSFQRSLSVSRVALICFVGINLATLFLLGSRGNPQLLAGFVVIQGSSYGLISIVRPLLAKQLLGGENFGAISGMMAVPFMICMAFAPTLASLLWERQGYVSALWVIWVLSMGGLFCLILSLTLFRGPSRSD